MSTDDPYSRVDYVRMVAWEGRLAREMPFLCDRLGKPRADRPVFDLGCGPGRHTEALAQAGYRAIGIDISESMLEKRSLEPAGVRFLRGDMACLPLRGKGISGGAVCLGNTLVALEQDDRYRECFRTVCELLEPGAPFVIQVLNYARILSKGIRHLPLNFRPTEDGEIIFLRIMDPIAPDQLRFELVTLERKNGRETELVRTTSTLLRPLQHSELTRFLKEAGFDSTILFGSYDGAPFDPDESTDVLIVARRTPSGL